MVILEASNPKLQIPSSNVLPSPNCPIPLKFGCWGLIGRWDLVLGRWDLTLNGGGLPQQPGRIDLRGAEGRNKRYRNADNDEEHGDTAIGDRVVRPDFVQNG